MAQYRKILFVDDDPFFRDSLSELLQLEGYQILEAASIDEAEQILGNAWVHMMLVDLNFTEDDDDDRSGMKLINPAYAAIPKIILTAHSNDNSILRRLISLSRGTSPVTLLGKDENGAVPSIISFFEKYVHINWDLQIEWSSSAVGSFVSLVGFVVSDADRDHLFDRVDELEDLFRQLFFDSDQITVGRLLGYNAGVVWLEIFAQKGVGGEESFVLACGQKQNIVQQLSQYDEFVPKSNTVGSVRQVQTIETLHFAATSYQCIGANFAKIASLHDIYLRWPRESVAQILSQLFSVALAAWHGSNTEQIVTLKDFYHAWTGKYAQRLDQAALTGKIQALCNKIPQMGGLSRIDYTPEVITVYTTGLQSESYPNPASFLFETGATIDTSVVVGKVHGHLQPENVLVDAEKRIWLIDFSQVQKCPVLLDFVSLESAFKADLLTMVDITTWYEIEKHLLEVKDLDEPIVMDHLSLEVQKILHMISVIRKQATIVANQNLRIYLAALFVYSITRLSTYDEKKTCIARDLVPYLYHLISAAMVCQYLTSPRQFEPDFIDKSVIVEGKKIFGFTKQELRLLEFMYERVGQVCVFEEILEVVYGDARDDIANGVWMKEYGKPKVNAAIGRLRKKLEPNPRNNTYILTEREHGYRLDP